MSIGNAIFVFFNCTIRFILLIAIFDPVDLALPHYHLILREGASLVAEYHLNLPKLLDQIRITALL